MTATVVNHVYEQSQAIVNYNNNQKHDSEVTGLFNGQGSLMKWKFGARTFDKNGCGVIATYNVMCLLGKRQKMSAVAYDIERKQGTLAWGYAGTDPTHPIEYFKSKGISSKLYWREDLFDCDFTPMKINQCALVCFWSDRNNKLSEGAHFVAVRKILDVDKSIKFEVYNTTNSCPIAITYTNLKGIMGFDGEFISGIIVN